MYKMEPAWISLFMKPLITPLSCVIVLNQLKCLPQIPFWGCFSKQMTTHPFMLWLSRKRLIRSSLFCCSMASSRRWNPCHTCHTLFEANIRIPQNCGCTKLLWICHLLSVYLTLQAGRVSLFYLSLHWSFITTHTDTHKHYPMHICTVFFPSESKFQKAGVSLFSEPNQRSSYYRQIIMTEIETLVSTYVNSFFLSLSKPIRFGQCQI